MREKRMVILMRALLALGIFGGVFGCSEGSVGEQEEESGDTPSGGLEKRTPSAVESQAIQGAAEAMMFAFASLPSGETQTMKFMGTNAISFNLIECNETGEDTVTCDCSGGGQLVVTGSTSGCEFPDDPLYASGQGTFTNCVLEACGPDITLNGSVSGEFVGSCDEPKGSGFLQTFSSCGGVALTDTTGSHDLGFYLDYIMENFSLDGVGNVCTGMDTAHFDSFSYLCPSI